ncbi:hypothetical protein OAG51_00455 [Pirellulaceae bacterium]|nr:hypothetical protein [Pirellulaceae bacterium]
MPNKGEMVGVYKGKIANSTGKSEEPELGADLAFNWPSVLNLVCGDFYSVTVSGDFPSDLS